MDDTVSGEEEREMNTIADTSEPASELERLIADLSESGLLVFVFGYGNRDESRVERGTLLAPVA